MELYNLKRENFSDVEKKATFKDKCSDSISTYEKSYLNSKERKKEEKARLKFERRKAYIELIDEHWGEEIRWVIGRLPLILVGGGIWILIFPLIFPLLLVFGPILAVFLILAYWLKKRKCE